MGPYRNMTFKETENYRDDGLSAATGEWSNESWRDALDVAVRETNEPAIWSILASQQNSDEAHEALANLVGRMAYSHGEKNIFCELFMMPIITEHGCNVINQKDVWKCVRQTTRDALRSWFSKEVGFTLFEGILPMDWITTWRPKILRDHLNRMLPGSAHLSAEFLTENIDLPDHAPKLGFVTMACSSMRGWPEVPEVNASMDKRLKDVVRHALQISVMTPSSMMAPVPTVLPPERLQFSITDGISLWLMKLHEAVGIASWTVMPSIANPDVVKITLRLNDEKVPLTQFAVRLHQIGLQGLNDIMSVLTNTAPHMEVPADMTQEQFKSLLTSTS